MERRPNAGPAGARRRRTATASAIGAVIGLAGARFRGRWVGALVIALAIAASVVVVGSLSGIRTLTEDAAMRRSLADLGAEDRVISIHLAPLDGTEEAEADRVARAALGPLRDITDPLMTVTVYDSQLEPVRLVAVDGATQWTTIAEGRAPAPCAGVPPCEAIRVGSNPLANGVGDVGREVTVSGFSFRIVGGGMELPALPFALASPGRVTLLVEGQATVRDAAALEALSRTSYWLAPINRDAVHSWDLADLADRVDAMERQLAPSGPLYQIRTPEQTLAEVAARAAVASGRLVFIGSLIVAFLLAFAAFAAAMERSSVAMEDERLRRAGASGMARAVFVVVEATLPAAAGLIVGELAAAAAVGGLALAAAAPPGMVIGLALLQPPALAVTAVLVALAIAAIIVGVHPGTERLARPRIVLAVIVPAGLLLAWMAMTTASLGPAALAGGPASPVTVILPGAVGLSVIVASLVLLPPLLRAFARATRRGPLGVRLAAISLARSPLRPAAVMTLLAFSTAVVAFAQIYAVTLRHGASDQAAFRVGSDIRIDALGVEGRFASEVLPFIRSTMTSDEDLEPMVWMTGTSASRRNLVVAGIDGARLASLRGWRRDFSSEDPAILGAAIHLDGEWSLPGQSIPAGAREVALDVTARGDPIHLSVIVEEADGRVRYVELGDLIEGRTTMRAPLFSDAELAHLDPSQPSGWRIVGLLASTGGPGRAPGSLLDVRQQADVTIEGLASIVDPTRPVRLDVFSSRSPQLIRGVARTDGLVLPAIVRPDLAGHVDPAGTLYVRVGQRLDLRFRPVEVVTRFPTIVEAGPMIVADLDPVLLAMNANEPGSGVPNRAVLRTTGDQRAAELVSAIEHGPFPNVQVESRSATEQRLANDPFGVGLGSALSISGLAALALSVVGVTLAAASELREGRGDLWELEAQGVTPRALIGVVMIRTLAMCLAGAASGILAAVALSLFAVSALAVGADGGVPVPPLQLVAPWAAVLAVPAAVVTIIAIIVLAVTRRHFVRASLGAAQ